ncbi:MAG: c-type cytochrome [candidate division NC10 bacterium]|nr:c-type cytochrome [candidate division NC10 bacterium]
MKRIRATGSPSCLVAVGLLVSVVWLGATGGWSAEMTALLETGKRVYGEKCAVCHGEGGKGDGPAGKVLVPRPPDFTDPRFMASKTDADFLGSIDRGKGAMPAWEKILTAEERQAVLAYMRSFARVPEAAPPPKEDPKREVLKRPDGTSIAVEARPRVVASSGSKVKVGEYDPLRSGADVRADLSGKTGENLFDLRGAFKDGKDWDVNFSADLQRYLRLGGDWRSMLHRLEHDPLTNLGGFDPAFPSSNVVDTDPGRAYGITRRWGEVTAKGTLPQLPLLQFFAQYRRNDEIGHQQATTITHCATCHVTSSTQDLRQKTDEYRGGFEARLGPVTLAYTGRYQEFNERATPPTAFYPPAVGVPPMAAALVPVVGQVPFAQVPDTHTLGHQVEVRADLSPVSFYGSYYNSATENQEIDRDARDQRANLRATARLVRGLTATAKYEWLDRDNDVPSAIDRQIQATGIDLSYHLWRSVTATAGYEYRHVRRDNFPFDRLSLFDSFLTKTTRSRTHAFYAALNSTLHPTLRAYLRYDREETDNPFTRFGKQGCFMPDDSMGAVGAPPDFPFAGKRPGFEFPDMTVEPENVDRVTLRLTWSPLLSVTVPVTYRFSHETNDRVDRDQDSHNVSAGIVFTPFERLALHTFYSYERRDITATVVYGSQPFFGTAIDLPGTFITPIVDGRTPYLEEVHSISGGVDVRLSRALTATSNVQYTKSDAAVTPRSVDRDVRGFSALEIRQVGVSAGLKYRITPAIHASLEYLFQDYDDRQSSLDGRASTVFVGVAGRF